MREEGGGRRGQERRELLEALRRLLDYALALTPRPAGVAPVEEAMRVYLRAKSKEFDDPTREDTP